MILSNQAITRPFNYAIVDEADSLLIDDCRNPLIISDEPDTGATERFLLAHKVNQLLHCCFLVSKSRSDPLKRYAPEGSMHHVTCGVSSWCRCA